MDPKSNTASPAKSSKPAPTKGAAVVGAKEKYATMLVGIGKTHEDKHNDLVALAETLGLKVGTLVWHAVGLLLASPPKAGEISAPVTARGAVIGVGKAPGFWIVPVLGTDGKTSGVKVVEVAKRSDTLGREFYRYQIDEGDAKATDKNRTRAKNQAVRGAQADMRFLGIKGDVTVTELAAAPKV
jgi:hypothetical protein